MEIIFFDTKINHYFLKSMIYDKAVWKADETKKRRYITPEVTRTW